MALSATGTVAPPNRMPLMRGTLQMVLSAMARYRGLMESPTRWRPMRAADLPAVTSLADAIHTEHPEDAAVFAERLALYPVGCLVLQGEGGISGYAIAHPWTATAPPALDSLLGALPAGPDAFHLHDIVLDPAARGRGHAAAVLAMLFGQAVRLRLPRATLVAVAGTADYWQRQGFRPIPPRDAAALESYGPGAAFMARHLYG